MKQKLLYLCTLLCFMCIGGGNAWGEEVELYRESFTSTTTKAAAATADKVTATQSMFFDKTSTVWSHYITCSNISKAQTATHTATYCKDKQTTSIQHTAQAASTEYTILEVTGIDISGASNLKLNYAFGFSGGTNYKAFAKIDDGDYVQIKTATSGGQWQYVTDTSIAGVGSQLSLKFTYKSNKSGNIYYLDEILVTGTKENGQTPETPTVTAPTFDVAAGTYTEDQLVIIDNYDENYHYAYTLDGTDPAFDAELNVTNGTAYDKNEGIEITSSCTLKVIAVDINGNTSSITSAAYVINKPIVFASLEDLVDADLTSGTNVTVSFENIAIKDIFVTQQGYRNGVYFDIQKGGKDIEIYYQNVPEEWVVGGTLSGTMTCPWKTYSGTWELAPASGSWAWTNLTYTAPTVKTITALEVSGTPTKTTYNVGDAFETAGLVVTATYSDETTATLTTGFDWEIDYGTGNDAFVAGATSVDVMVYTDDVMSEVYTVNDLTVTVPVTLTSIAVSGTPTKTEYYAGDAFETAGLVVTGTYSDSHQETITEGIEWTIDPETLALGTTSVEVMAGVGSVVSEVYTVEGLTVTKAPFETVTYTFSEFTSGQTVELTDLDGFVITLKKGESSNSNPAWNSDQAKLYAGGSLTVKANNAIIKSIEYEYTVNANKNNIAPAIDGVKGKISAGNWDAENKTWTGADEEVTFSTSGTAGNIGFTKLIIKYVEATKIETSLAWSATEAEVTIGDENNVFPTLTTTPVDLAGVTYESSNTDVATVSADGTIDLKKVGKTTITAKYEGDVEHATATPVSYTLIVNKAPFVPKPAEDGYETVDFAAMYSSVSTSETVEDYEGTSFAMAFAKPQSSNTPTKYYDNGKAVRAYEGNTITITTAENISDVDIAWAGTNVDDAVSITGLGSTTAVVAFSKTCRFTSITVYYKNEVRETASGKYGTLCLPYAATVKGAKLYTISSIENNVITMEEVENIEAGKPYIYQAQENKQTFNCVSAAVAKPVEDDYLVGVFEKTEVPAGSYVLQTQNGVQGFYKVSSETSTVYSSAYKCYLTVPANNGVKAFYFDGNATGVDAIEALTNGSAKIYDLNGRHQKTLQKGVNIVNGVKFIVK